MSLPDIVRGSFLPDLGRILSHIRLPRMLLESALVNPTHSALYVCGRGSEEVDTPRGSSPFPECVPIAAASPCVGSELSKWTPPTQVYHDALGKNMGGRVKPRVGLASRCLMRGPDP